MPRILDAPAGEDSASDGTEAVPVTGSKYMLISTIAAYIRTLTQTLTNKTIDLGSNTVTGTTAQFNTALSDNNFATLAGSETLTNKTLTAPTIADFTNMAHDHGDADDGGAIALIDDTAYDATSWNGVTTIAPSKNAVRDKIESLVLGSSDSFKTISVSGQSDVVADSSTDTLTLAAGSNITITTNAGTDTITITGSGGGVTDAEYVTSASHASLSAEVVIPGLAGGADIAGTGRAGVAHEFDSGGSPFTWSRAIDTETVDSTVKSHLYIEDNGTTEALGTYAWSPAGAFDIRVKVSLGTEMGTTSDIVAAGLIVGDSAMNNRVLCQLEFAGATDRFQVSAYTYAGSYITRGAVQTGMGSVIYLRIVRDGSNNNSFYYSSNGLNWLLIATQALTYTAAKAGLRLDPSPSGVTTNAAIDWIGSDV